MKSYSKAEITGSLIGLFCIYVVLGTIYHFVVGYSFVDTLRLLAIQTFLLVIFAIPIVVIIGVLFFVIGKIKR